MDGPNVYTYVRQNPWTSFDPDGLEMQMPAAVAQYHGFDTTNQQYQAGVKQGASGVFVVAVTAGATTLPGVGEGMDAAVIADPESTPLEKKIAAGSLAANGFTAGVFPNLGGILRVGREMTEQTLKHADDAAEVLTDTARGIQEAAEKAAKEATEKAGKAPVKPGDEGTYGDLKSQKKADGETEPLDMDHQPSFAAQVKAREAELGRELKPAELAELKKALQQLPRQGKSINRPAPHMGEGTQMPKARQMQPTWLRHALEIKQLSRKA